MEGLKIFSGDVLVGDRSITPQSGMIVVAAVFGEMVVKQLHKQQDRLQLISANDNYEPIEINDADDVFVWGVVTGSTRTFR
jgi:DNA polymerase V